MALERETRLGDPTVSATSRSGDKIVDDYRERDAGRSNFAAFLLGGVVIAGGLLAFLYYDTNSLQPRDTLTTGSILQIPSASSPVPARPQAPAPVPSR